MEGLKLISIWDDIIDKDSDFQLAGTKLLVDFGELYSLSEVQCMPQFFFSAWPWPPVSSSARGACVIVVVKNK